MTTTEPTTRPDVPAPSRGEQRRARPAAAVARGQHPLSVPLGAAIPLHPAATRSFHPDAPGPRCGDCAHRQNPHHTMGRSRSKCTLGAPERTATTRDGRTITWRDTGPRDTRNGDTDVPLYWPACTDHQPTGGAR